ncbi:MAG: 5-oxoprolinase subunit B family protein [Nitritalea sp.]
MPKPAQRYFRYRPGHVELHWPAKICSEQLETLRGLRQYLQVAYPKAIIRHTYHILSILHPPDAALEQALESVMDAESPLWQRINPLAYSQRTWVVPLCYAPTFAPDLPEVCATLNLEPEAFITLHSQTLYTVYFQGFMPGFYYLGGLDSRLHLPRKDRPTRRLPAGTCGIGGEQTGIYPSESPGGWWQIAHCPIALLPPYGKEPLMQAGDHLRFHPINQTEHQNIQQEKATLTLIQNRYG